MKQLLVSLLIIIVSCKSSTDMNQTTQRKTFTELAKEKLGNKFSCQFSENDQYVLCESTQTKDRVELATFFVFDQNENQIVYQPKGQTRKVEWDGGNTLKVHSMVGTPSSDNPDGVYYYDLKKKQKFNSKP